MGLDRRIVVALSVIAVIIAPAAVLRTLCVGHSCDETEDSTVSVPFCSLPEDQRAGIVAGFREGRSPDVLVVSDREPDDRVPLLFHGPGFGDLLLPDGITIDRVAPTLAAAAGIERPHPEVRSGRAVGSFGRGSDPHLLLVIALEGIGKSNFDASSWDRLDPLKSAATSKARVGSLPLDPTAAVTTLGTGGLPNQHGITGRLIRNDSGRVVEAWSEPAPVSVIATLADDLDEMNNQKAKIGLVASAPTRRGLIGGNWYVDLDRDDVRFAKDEEKQVAAARSLLRSGYGSDQIPDFLGVVLEAEPGAVNAAVGTLLQAARKAADGRVVAAVVGLGAGEKPPVDPVAAIEQNIEEPRRLIEGAVPGGFFVDQDALAETGKTDDDVIEAVKDTGTFAEAFAAITVTFARYC